jgi:hypothetical protein
MSTLTKPVTHEEKVQYFQKRRDFFREIIADTGEDKANLKAPHLWDNTAWRFPEYTTAYFNYVFQAVMFAAPRVIEAYKDANPRGNPYFITEWLPFTDRGVGYLYACHMDEPFIEHIAADFIPDGWENIIDHTEMCELYGIQATIVRGFTHLGYSVDEIEDFFGKKFPKYREQLHLCDAI